ncbi:MAG: type I-U CRISPR-associated protein Cas5/Cas6 [Chloroflexota bacterium]|nr:type I-U CRISPR-associated protein Cas5/Cas6 [Chloroflexota bacterium]
MSVEVTFVTGRYHGQRRGGRENDWPPAPHRLFQALIAAAHLGSRASAWSEAKAEAFRWLECRDAPEIATPPAECTSVLTLSVPNNDMDVVARAWTRRAVPPRRPAELRDMKTLRPIALGGDATVRFLWPISDEEWGASRANAELLCEEARHLHHLGLGIDLVAGRGRFLDEAGKRALPGETWLPDASAKRTRIPMTGSLDELLQRHAAFKQRVSGDVDPPTPPERVRWVGYRRRDEARSRRVFAFLLVREDGARASFDPRKTAYVAAWLRHAARDAAARIQLEPGFVESYVCGHGDAGGGRSRRLSYLPLPSIGHMRIDGRIRRVLLVDPLGQPETRTQTIVRSLQGASLMDETNVWRADLQPVADPKDGEVFRAYLSTAKVWGSVTPVVLPGYDDRDPRKATRLILKSLAQAGYDTPVAEISLEPLPVFPGAERAETYFVPEYMRSSRRTHLVITFAHPVSGPLAIGRGRHVGLGLMAPVT